jgi:hypothetical protein
MRAEHPPEDRIDLLGVVAEVEQCGELGGREVAGDVRVLLQQREEIGVSCQTRIALRCTA